MLRWRLSVGLVTLMALLIAVGIYAVWLFNNLGSAVDQVLENNYRDIKAINQIRVATSRINGTYFTVDRGVSGAFDKTFYYDNRVVIDQAMQILRTNQPSPAAFALVKRFEAALTTYFDLYDQFFKPGPRRPEDDRMIRQQIQDSTLLVTELAEQILQANEQAMFDADRVARAKSTDSIHFMLVAMALALLISGYASYRLGKSLLEPIHLLTDFTGKIGEGNLDITVPVISEDELGKLASSFNTMAGQLRAYRQTTTEQIFNLNQTMEVTLATFPDPIFVLDREQQIRLCNPAAQRFADDLGFVEGLPPELATKVGEVLETRQDYLPSTFKDAYYYRISDQEKSFLPRVLMMWNQDRTPHGVAVVLQDITRFRLLDDVKTNLVSTVSHELRTPLTSIRMALHILLEKKLGALTPKQSELLVVAREDSERLLRTLNDLLDLSRLEDSSHELHYDRVAPSDILREVAGETAEVAHRAGVRVELEADSHLPSLPMDRVRMKHVFINLIENAVKHSQDQGVVTVRVCPVDGSLLRFSVIDDGEGVPAEYQSRVFEKFFRVPGQPRGGAGLGLSIARQIVQAHHGHIGVISEPGRGAEFYCDLPLEEPEKKTLSGADGGRSQT